MAETRKSIDCRRFPADKPCSIVIAGTEEDVHDGEIKHGHADTPELREQLRTMLKDESASPAQAA